MSVEEGDASRNGQEVLVLSSQTRGEKKETRLLRMNHCLGFSSTSTLWREQSLICRGCQTQMPLRCLQPHCLYPQALCTHQPSWVLPQFPSSRVLLPG